MLRDTTKGNHLALHTCARLWRHTHTYTLTDVPTHTKYYCASHMPEYALPSYLILHSIMKTLQYYIFDDDQRSSGFNWWQWACST